MQVDFDIKRERLAAYLETTYLIVGLCCFGVGAIVVWLLLRLGLHDAIRRWAKAFQCSLTDDRLVVKSCFKMWGFTWHNSERSVPLEKITDVKLVQGPILNRMGLWNLRIQTAGSGAERPEAILFALKQPHESRDLILDAIGKRMARGTSR